MVLSIRRALQWAIGLGLLVVYVGAAVVVYQLLALLVRRPPALVPTLAAIALVTLATAYFSYRFGTRQLLAGIGARQLEPREAPALFRRLDALCSVMAVQRPTVYVADLGTPNAFALGGVRSGSLVVDVSLFRLLGPSERTAIFAHELAHLETYDAFVQTLAYSAMRTLIGLVMLPLLPLFLIAGGVARALAWMRGQPLELSRNPATLIHYWARVAVTTLTLALTALIRAHSRRREYAADDRAVEVTGDPAALARALRTIERASERSHGLLSTLYVSDDEDDEPLTRLLSTHPPMDERIERLRRRIRTQ